MVLLLSLIIQAITVEFRPTKELMYKSLILVEPLLEGFKINFLLGHDFQIKEIWIHFQENLKTTINNFMNYTDSRYKNEKIFWSIQSAIHVNLKVYFTCIHKIGSYPLPIICRGSISTDIMFLFIIFIHLHYLL